MISMKWVLYIIGVSSWILFLYQNTAEKYGYMSGTFFMNGYGFLTGLISVIVCIFLMSEFYDYLEILGTYFLFLLIAGALIGGLKHRAQGLGLFGLVIGYVLFFINKFI